MIEGIVVHGDGLGKQFGFPTANIECTPQKTKYKPGVYAAQAYLYDKEYKAALVIQKHPWKVEVYLIDYHGEDIYGLLLRVEPIQRVSEFERFDSSDELIKKIHRDVEIICQLLA